MRMDSADISRDVHSRLTQVTIHLSAVKYMGRLIMSLRLCESFLGIMDENGVVEEDDGTWVALVVLASKPHQENVPWREYQWRLCVS